MAYGKRRVSNYNRPRFTKRKYVSKPKKSYKKPMYKRLGYRKKYGGYKKRSYVR